LIHGGRFIQDKKINDKINVFTRSDESGAAEVWAKFLGKEEKDLKGKPINGDPAITEVVKNDRCGISFNK